MAKDGEGRGGGGKEVKEESGEGKGKMLVDMRNRGKQFCEIGRRR